MLYVRERGGGRGHDKKKDGSSAPDTRLTLHQQAMTLVYARTKSPSGSTVGTVVSISVSVVMVIGRRRETRD